jgi:Secretory lipase
VTALSHFGPCWRRLAERFLPGAFLKVTDLTRVEPWRTLLMQNTPRGAETVPIFLAQGTADSVVDPAVTATFKADLCRRGVPVRSLFLSGVIHAAAAWDSASGAVAWMAERFEGVSALSDCQS